MTTNDDYEMSLDDLAHLWYLRFDHEWVYRDDLDNTWHKIFKALKRSGLLEYQALQMPNKWHITEAARLKGELDGS